ncbi:MAG: cytochrome c biogenesis protein CcsA [Phycisphaeraceae bacterium]|nr:cytochrome c biogenesis protein CcsA [Phycisphaeraceae bacterium]
MRTADRCMNPGWRCPRRRGRRPAGTVLHVFLVLLTVTAVTLPAAGRQSPAPADTFADRLDLRGLDRLAVHMNGRVRSFESHATALIRQVVGPKRLEGRSASFTYLDMMIRPERYESLDCIWVQNKLVRGEIRRALEASLESQIGQFGSAAGRLTPAQEQGFRDDFRRRMDGFMSHGRIAPVFLTDPFVQRRLQEMSADVVRTAKPVERLASAMSIRRPEVLSRSLNFLPPPSGAFDEPWHTLDELAAAREGDRLREGLPPGLRDEITSAWSRFREAWRIENAEGVNDAVVRLTSLLPAVNDDPEIYPAAARLAWESWYFRSSNLVWIWIIYGLALVPLLLHAVFRWPAARRVGMAMFIGAVLLHTFSVMLRWYVSGRWPNSNMYEAVTTSVWFSAVFALGFELFLRRSPLRSLIAIAACVASAVALMCAHFLPAYLDPSIHNMMPVLHDVWLYIHTNVIIFSYALIFMAAVSAFIYLVLRLAGWVRGVEPGIAHATAGGAASLIMVGSDGRGMLERSRTTFAQVLDGTTMILMELSFILLWAGIVMGAIWADHSWGRPWGWDPKEVFALNTFIVLAVLVHLRIRTRDKGLWTAILAVIGAAVMLFNWVVINFTIAGLHSYA